MNPHTNCYTHLLRITLITPLMGKYKHLPTGLCVGVYKRKNKSESKRKTERDRDEREMTERIESIRRAEILRKNKR